MAAGDITKISDDVQGTKGVIVGTIELPASYVTGGTAIAGLFGFTTLDFVSFEPILQDADEAVIAAYNRTSAKLQVFQAVNAADALQELGSGSAILSGLTVRFRAEGRK